MKRKKYYAVSITLVLILAAAMILPAIAAPIELNPGIIKDMIAPDHEQPTVSVSDAIPEPSKNQNLTGDIDESMKNALTAVKKYFTIDDKIYPQFSYDYSAGEKSSDTKWYFTWNSQDYKKTINAGVSNGGKIFSYNKYDFSDQNVNRSALFAEVTKSEAQKAADGLLQKLFGDEFKNYKLVRNTLYYPSISYQLGYIYNKNGYDFAQYYIDVNVDKFTGEITSFGYSNASYYADEKDFNFQDASKVISKQDAVKSYLENFGLDMIYANSYDYQTRKLTVKPVYSVKTNYANEFISAADGKRIKVEFASPDADADMGAGFGYDDIAPSAAPMAETTQNAAYDKGGANEVILSEAETAELEKIKNYITSQKAVEIFADICGLAQDDLKNLRQNIRLQTDYINQNQYLWNIDMSSNDSDDGSYKYYYGQIDARNGNIITYSIMSGSYYRSVGNGSNEQKTVYTYDEAKKIVTEQIKKISPYDLDGNFELVESENMKTVPIYTDVAGGKMLGSSNPTSYYFNYIRKVNGIQFPANNIYVTFDNVDGRITSYRLTWYEDAVFPGLANVISEEQALNTIIDYTDFAVSYVSNSKADNKVNVDLVYNFKNYLSNYVDAVTGKYINMWDFSEVNPDEYKNITPEYNDLTGHWSEKTVKTLADNGIYVWGGDKFDPDKAITKGELLSYLAFYAQGYNNSYRYDDSAASIFKSPSLSKNTNDMDSEKPLTRQEAAQIICEYIGYGEIGKHYDIFKYPFDDTSNYSDESYRGYITVIKTFELIYGDGTGNYNAKSPMTRAEAATVLYNMIIKLANAG